MNEKVKKILVDNGLDFRINKLPLVAIDENEQKITPYYGLFNSKTGECINTCKEGYTVSQNEEVIEMVLKGMEKFGSKIKVSDAYSLNGGRRILAQLLIEGVSKVGNDTIQRYVTIVDSNDGSTGLSIGIGDMASHCMNQYFKFYKGSDAKFRHTATIEKKIQTIPTLIELALSKSMEQVGIYKKFLSTPVSKGLADKLVKAVLGHDRLSIQKEENPSTRTINMIETFYGNIETEYNAVGESVWGLFNGLTRYTTHEMNSPKRDNGKIESLVTGTGYKKSKIGFDLLVKEAGILV